MIFIDTSAWYALEVEDDINHERALDFLANIASGKQGISVTTDYILDETLTLLRSRRDLDSAVAFIDKIRKSKSIRVFWVTENLFEQALKVFKKSDDKNWSFTDCTSFALMAELSVSSVFSFDKHFREAGFRSLPE
jgi:Predicted nucleic acid-binding protein, contains PIN domain